MNFLSRFKKRSTRIYLDHAAATPIHPEVIASMKPYWRTIFANASAVHTEGRAARAAIEAARGALANVLRVQPGEIIFTGSGTESNMLAILGTIEALAKQGTRYEDIEVLTSTIEHPSVLEAMRTLSVRGTTVRYAPVGPDGRIDRESFAALLSVKTALVSVAYVNSEIGTVEDIRTLAHIIQKFNTEHGTLIRLHSDASQAPLWLPCQMDALGADLMTLDAGKCAGPKGAGVLVRRRAALIEPQTKGGGQEGGLRAGTENTPLIVGSARAITRAQEGWKERSARIAPLRDSLFKALERAIPEAVRNGSREHRIANNVNISIVGFDSEYAVIDLDAHGVAASTKSACGSADSAGSHVVKITGDDRRARSTLRFTLGEGTTQKEINHAVKMLAAHVDRMRAFASRTGAET